MQEDYLGNLVTKTSGKGFFNIQSDRNATSNNIGANMVLYMTMKNWVDKYYQGMADTHCNTCHVGAWSICREQYLLEKSGDGSMKTFFQRFTRNNSSDANAALAQEVQNVPECDRPQCKILVVCKGSTFSQGVIDYAIDMATKTRSALVALNLDEDESDFAGFQARAEHDIQRFAYKASASGLHFSHEIRHGREDSVIDQLYKADSDFRYVVDDSAAVCRNKKIIPVYTRATLRAK